VLTLHDGVAASSQRTRAQRQPGLARMSLKAQPASTLRQSSPTLHILSVAARFAGLPARAYANGQRRSVRLFLAMAGRRKNKHGMCLHVYTPAFKNGTGMQQS
jgi:hypothetical protein